MCQGDDLLCQICAWQTVGEMNTGKWKGLCVTLNPSAVQEAECRNCQIGCLWGVDDYICEETSDGATFASSNRRVVVCFKRLKYFIPFF